MNHTICFVLGGPGSGKGTFCKHMTEEFGFKHISLGDVIRTYMNENPTDEDVIRYKKTLDAGICIPPEESIKFLMKVTDNMYEDAKEPVRVMIDGYPRSIGQLDAYNKFSSFPFIKDIILPSLFLIYLDTSEKVMKERLYNRNRDYRDRNSDVIARRLTYFYTDTMEVINTIKKNMPDNFLKFNGNIEQKENIELMKNELVKRNLI